MTDIEQKALALVNEVQEFDCGVSIYHVHNAKLLRQALCRAIEQHEAFRQEVSDAVVEYFGPKDLDVILAGHLLERLINPKPKPDPLVEVLHEVDTGPEWDSPEDYCNKIRAALEARGLEIREKNDDD